ncbi:MAG: efflux RND transporter periplasmic adaptor subunit [Phascolarctobacterium sp.]|nr:efflux RND transporter periplasmic adaptor subunit [Phascolarctobacterium sp.]
MQALEKLRAHCTTIKKYVLQHKAVALVGVCVLGLVLASGVRYFANKRPVRVQAVKPEVHVLTMAKRDMYRQIPLFGQLKPRARIDIINKYAGLVEKINVDLGSRVEAGELLLAQRLDDAEAEMLKTQARYREASAYADTHATDYSSNLMRYEADYKLAKLNAERYDKLFKLGAVSQYERDAMEQTMINKKALYEELALQEQHNGVASQVYRQQQVAERRYQEYQIAQNKYQDMLFKAPRSGIITYRNAEVGGYVAAGTKLLTLLDDSGFTVDCDVTESDVAAISIGTPVALTVEALGQEVTGKVIYISPDRSRETNKFFLRVELDKVPEQVKAGLFARGELRFLQKPQILYLNKSSLTDRNGTYYAYVVDNKKKVQQRKVKLGASNAQEVEILQGLEVGDQVVLDNLSRMRNGLVVDVAKEE